MSTTPEIPQTRDLQLAFDVGHSSLGWAVLQVPPGQSPALLGCGAVIFQADDCLASQRRGFRRAVLTGDGKFYRPWTPRNSRWAG